MATIDEILAAMPAEAAADYEYLVIDPVARTITVPEAEEVFGVESDEVAERKHFMCPRYVGDGLDLAGMFLTVYFRNAYGDEDGYLVDDVAVSGEYVTFSWLLSAKVTQYKGEIQFAVCADLPNTAEKKRPDWNTTLATGTVLEGMDPADVGDVEENTSDLMTQLRETVAAQTAAVEAEGAEQVAAVAAAGDSATAAAVKAIQDQGAATLASLPADYTDLANTVDGLTRSRAAAIVCEAEGTAVQLSDASADPLLGLRIFGRSTQDGTPTPDAPVDIVSLAAPTVGVYGKNLINCADASVSGVNEYYHTFVTQFKPVQGKTYTLSMDVVSDVLPFSIHVGAGKGSYHSDFNPNIVRQFTENGRISVTFTWQLSETQIAAGHTTLAFRVPKYAALATFNATISNIQLELGDVATEYEPHKEAQTLTVTTPDGLPGIPVASGGNYTDANGQQWIADEVDLARGVYVQRVKVLKLDGSSDFTIYKNLDAEDRWLYTVYSLGIDTNIDGRGYCDKLQYNTAAAMNAVGANTVEAAGFSASNSYGVLYVNIGYLMTENTVEGLRAILAESPYTFLLALKTPIETPLTDAEVQAFRALHSNKTITTVLNSAGAFMALEYAADPKTYIDNKLAALTAAT